MPLQRTLTLEIHLNEQVLIEGAVDPDDISVEKLREIVLDALDVYRHTDGAPHLEDADGERRRTALLLEAMSL